MNTQNTQPSKTMKNQPTIKRILSYLLPYKKEFTLAFLLLALTTIIGFLQPLTIQQITDVGMLARDLPALCRSIGALALLVSVNQAIEMAQTRLFVDVHNRSYYGIFHGVFQKLLHLKRSYFEDKNNAEILSCLQMDVSQVASITDRYTVMSVSQVFRIILWNSSFRIRIPGRCCGGPPSPRGRLWEKMWISVSWRRNLSL